MTYHFHNLLHLRLCSCFRCHNNARGCITDYHTQMHQAEYKLGFASRKCCPDRKHMSHNQSFQLAHILLLSQSSEFRVDMFRRYDNIPQQLAAG